MGNYYEDYYKASQDHSEWGEVNRAEARERLERAREAASWNGDPFTGDYGEIEMGG